MILQFNISNSHLLLKVLLPSSPPPKKNLRTRNAEHTNYVTDIWKETWLPEEKINPTEVMALTDCRSIFKLIDSYKDIIIENIGISSSQH